MGGSRTGRTGDGAPSVESEALDDLLRALAQAPARTPPSHPVQGEKWGADGRYVIERRLGRGGMGTVYAAADSLLGRVIALKVLESGDTEEDAKHRPRLLREARLAAPLEHERVARVYDVGEHDGRAFVAMEYVRGATLRVWMSSPRTPAEIVEVVRQIAEGLAALHARGVVHRDLKPENVMLPESGGLKLLDFGLAGQVAPEGDAELRANDTPRDGSPLAAGGTSAFLGTPGYMAPEQYAGRPLDARADVFALGVVVYELVTGGRPFAGKTLAELAHATETAPAQMTAAVWSRFPEGFRPLVTRMLAHDPAERLRNGAALVTALAELAAPVGRSAPPRARPRPMRRVLLVATLGVLVATGIAMEPRVAREIARRRLQRTPPPFGMALVDEGALTVGQPQASVDVQCTELGPLCRPKILSYQVPARRVTVAPFYLEVREVTNQELVDVLNGATGSLHVELDEDDRAPRYVRLDAGLGAAESFLVDLAPKFSGILTDGKGVFRTTPGREHWPANQVTWFGARFYCRAQGKRLPTENEWEAAARGAEDRRFPWGAAPPRCGQVLVPNDGYLSVAGCAETASLGDVATWVQDVTPAGIHDLGGSVAEWVDTVYSDEGRDREGAPSPEAPRVFRGGSFFYSYMARTSVRNKRPGNTAHIDVGFRCAADVR